MSRALLLNGLVLILILGFIYVATIGGCNNGNNKAVNADLQVAESDTVPGQAVMDASGSITENNEIVSYEFTVIDRDAENVAAEYYSITSKNSSFSPILGKGNYRGIVTVEDETGATDTTKTEFALESNCISETNVGQCCSSDNKIFTCVLSEGASSVDLDTLVQLIAIGFPEVASDIDGNTVMWIQAWGATGGNSNDSGAYKGGKTGAPGFAQTITTISDLDTSEIHYYIGNQGTHDCCGGSGGSSSIVTSVSLGDMLVAGGAGGGGGATDWCNGRDGKNGGVAIATTGGNAVGAGESNGSHCTGGSASGDGSGGSSDTQPNYGDGGSGVGGAGGSSQGESAPGFVNGNPNTSGGWGGGAGKLSLSGGGGGGYGGGGGTCGSGSGLCGCDVDCTDCPGNGGCGGGSFAKKSTKEDANAPTGYVSSNNWVGEVRVVFDLTP